MWGLLHSPSIPPGLSPHECGAVGSASHHLVRSASCSLACPVPQSATLLGPPAAASRHLAVSPLCPGSPSTPLLPVWMNVSSLSPWLLDFHTVQFSVSPACFLFLNCCCPSFGCARRHSVSTYASILAAIMIFFFDDIVRLWCRVLTHGRCWEVSLPSLFSQRVCSWLVFFFLKTLGIINQ